MPLHEHQGIELACPTAIYRWRARGASLLVTLLYPTPPGEGCPVVAIAADAASEATGVVLTLADGGAIALDEAEHPC